MRCLFVVFAFFVLLTSCSSPGSEIPLEGRWKLVKLTDSLDNTIEQGEAEDGFNLEFSKDGSYQSKLGPVDLKGTWELNTKDAANLLTLTAKDAPVGVHTFTVKAVNDKTLVLQEKGGQRLHYTKVQ